MTANPFLFCSFCNSFQESASLSWGVAISFRVFAIVCFQVIALLLLRAYTILISRVITILFCIYTPYQNYMQ